MARDAANIVIIDVCNNVFLNVECVINKFLCCNLTILNYLQIRNTINILQALFKDSIYGECRLIFTGKVTDKATRIVGGYDIGEATI